MTIHKRGQGFELRITVRTSLEVARVGLESRTGGLQVQPADHSATLISTQKKMIKVEYLWHSGCWSDGKINRCYRSISKT